MAKPLYDHAAVSYACFQPRPGPTLPLTQTGRPIDLTLLDGTAVGGYLVMHLSHAPVLMVLNSSDEILADQLSIWEDMAKDAGTNLFLLDWPGYASSSGQPSISACRAAARSALEFLLEREGEVPSVVVLGRGLGSVFAIDLFQRGAQSRVNGLILDSGIADLADWVADRVPWDQTGFKPEEVMAELDEALARDFTPQKTLATISVPVMIVHGLYDDKSPADNGRLLAKWANSTNVVWLQRGDNADAILKLNVPDYTEALKQFIAEAAPAR